MVLDWGLNPGPPALDASTISYEVGISILLQHTFTERRNHETRWSACLLTCLKC